ncbi:hypothetical protein M3J09_003254 [Ascochyta lentis]
MWVSSFAFASAESQRPCSLSLPWCVTTCLDSETASLRLATPDFLSCPPPARRRLMLIPYSIAYAVPCISCFYFSSHHLAVGLS